MNVKREQKPINWPQEANEVLNKARALVKYRGNNPDKIFQLKMDLANAIYYYDSMPNEKNHENSYG